MEHVTGIEWLNGTANEHNTPLSATNLNSINKDTETALNAIIDDVANKTTAINENMENKNYIKKYSGDSVVSSVVCGANDVTVTGKDLKVDNNIEAAQGKTVYTDYLSSRNNQNHVVNGKISSAVAADNVSSTIGGKDITGTNGIFEDNGTTAKNATNATNSIKIKDDNGGSYFKVSIVTSLPSTLDANTIYLRKL